MQELNVVSNCVKVHAREFNLLGCSCKSSINDSEDWDRNKSK